MKSGIEQTKTTSKRLKACAICGAELPEERIKRLVETCGKECSYKLRIKTRLTKHSPVEKVCDRCNETFSDTSKKKKVVTCQKCILEKMVTTRHENGSYVLTDEQKQARSEGLKNAYATGRRVTTDEERAIYRRTIKRTWATGKMREKTAATCMEKYGVDHWTKSDEGRKVLSELSSGRTFGKQARANMSAGAQKRVREGRNLHTRAHGGKRADLGHYVRSNWEANFARILRLQGRVYEYEPKTFQLTETMSYTPDFLVGETYYEIKGYMTISAKQKIELFKQQHPEVSFVLVDAKAYDLLREEFKTQILWEGK